MQNAGAGDRVFLGLVLVIGGIVTGIGGATLSGGISLGFPAVVSFNVVLVAIGVVLFFVGLKLAVTAAVETVTTRLSARYQTLTVPMEPNELCARIGFAILLERLFGNRVAPQSEDIQTALLFRTEDASTYSCVVGNPKGSVFAIAIVLDDCVQIRVIWTIKDGDFHLQDYAAVYDLEEITQHVRMLPY